MLSTRLISGISNFGMTPYMNHICKLKAAPNLDNVAFVEAQALRDNFDDNNEITYLMEVAR